MHVGGAFGPISNGFNGDAGRSAPRRSAKAARMVSAGRDAFASVSTIHTRAAAPSGRAAAPHVRTVGDATATFHFVGQVEGMAYPSLSPAQQETFMAEFCREAASILQWS